MAQQLPQGRQQYFDGNGLMLEGGKIYTYVSGTSTNKVAYQNQDQSTAHTNPIVLDARGEAEIWWNGTYKIIVKDKNDVAIPGYTVDKYGAGLAVVETVEPNLLQNASFELDGDADGKPDDWTFITYTGATVTIDNADSRHGVNSMKFTSVGSGGGYGETTNFFEISQDRQLNFGFSIKSSVAGVRNLVQIYWYKGDKTASATPSTNVYDNSTTNRTGWQPYNYRPATPSDAKFAKIRIYGCHPSDSTPGTVRYDDLWAFLDIGNINNSTTPAGVFYPYFGAVAPTGYLLMDNTEYSCTTYEDLVVAIAASLADLGLGTAVGAFTADSTTDTLTLTSHGKVDDDVVHVANSGGALPTGLTANTIYYIITATTNTYQLSLTKGGAAVDFSSNGTGTNSLYDMFQLDIRGRLPLGADNMGGSSANRVTATEADNLGQGSGAEDHTLIEAELPSHTHGINITFTAGSGGNQKVTGAGSTPTGATGGGGSHNIMQPYLTSNYIIKT